jgi:hypothetical protein
LLISDNIDPLVALEIACQVIRWLQSQEIRFIAKSALLNAEPMLSL